MSELLLEIFSGEIPAKMQLEACSKFAELFSRNIRESYENFDFRVTSWITPQRMGLCMSDFELSAVIPRKESIRGPKVGASDIAIQGFLKKYGIEAGILKEEDGYLIYEKSFEGVSLKASFADIIIRSIREFVWPKSMVDGLHYLRWVRPMKNILCILNGEVIEFTYHHLSSNSKTFGHRFMSSGELHVESYSQYLRLMEAQNVMLGSERRRDYIIAQAAEKLVDVGVSIIEDRALLEEVSGLVEYPVILRGKIPEEFMSLPKEVLLVTLKQNQKYLMTHFPDGRLSPYYIIVSNTLAEDGGSTIIEGNQRVLNARLFDAKFFYDHDVMLKLEERIDGLKKVAFHADIGSLYDKQLEVLSIAEKLCNELKIEEEARRQIKEAVMLCKCDLLTDMVKEFPELQGIMGGYYAIAGGYSVEVAEAIRDHYKPQGPSDALPSGTVAAVVAIADKLAVLKLLFKAGIRATGSKDPFALRRAAIGIWRIHEHMKFSIDFEALDLEEAVLEFLFEKKP